MSSKDLDGEIESVRASVKLLRNDFETYRDECERDRKKLNGEIQDVKDVVTRLESKTDEQTALLKQLVSLFTGFFNEPKIRNAGIACTLAILGYITWRVTPVPHAAPQGPMPAQIIVYPPVVLDGGSITPVPVNVSSDK